MTKDVEILDKTLLVNTPSISKFRSDQYVRRAPRNYL